jgi:hypothetical protein
MNTIRRSIVPLVIAGGLGFAAGITFMVFFNADAGDLEPSAPPGPTMKTLDEVEPRIPITSAPYTISSPGSYYFTGDLTSAMYGINVSADNVTIDLMGYTLAYGGSADAYGIYINGRNNVEIRNGTVRDFTETGIYEHGDNSKGHRIVDVRVVSNGGDGIYLNGYSHLVKDCISTGNTKDGIQTGGSCTVARNTCYDNSYNGILADYGSTISGNTCYSNDGEGIDASLGSNVLGNTSRYNQNWGIHLDGDNFVAQNSATSNNQSGGAYGNMNSSATSTYGLNHRP